MLNRTEANVRNYRTGLLVLGLLAGVAFFAASPTQAAPEEKITICHAAGDEFTTHFIELTLSPNGVFGGGGQAGHFNEDGTPKAGHEQDVFGPCEEKEDPPEPPKGV